MNYIDLAHQMEGMNTLQMLQEQMKVNRARAVYLMYRLRKKGFVITKRLSNGKRIYYISPSYAAGGTSYLDVLNKYAPLGLKLMEHDVYRIYGKELTVEETMIYSLKRESVRYILASLCLFREINNWPLLYRLAKKENLVRPIVALYEIARLAVPKVRQMPKRFKNLARPKKTDRYIYLVPKMDSQNFKHIERKWKARIPINQADLEDVKFEFALKKKFKRTSND